MQNLETIASQSHSVQLGLGNILGIGTKILDDESKLKFLAQPKIPVLAKQEPPRLPETTGPKKFSKRDYNKAYYQQRKQERTIPVSEAPSTAENGVPAKPNTPSVFSGKISWREMLIRFEILLLLALISFMTVLLVKESAGFYLDSQEAPWISYLKAGMVEAIAVLFSFSRSKCKALRWGQRALVVMLCLFTLSLMSGKAVKTASTDTLKVETVKQTLQQLESELS